MRCSLTFSLALGGGPGPGPGRLYDEFVLEKIDLLHSSRVYRCVYVEYLK